MALMGEEWALISASCVKLSMAHSLSIPPRQALSKVLLPGRKSSAHTQSLWAELMDCRPAAGKERQGNHPHELDPRVMK